MLLCVSANFPDFDPGQYRIVRGYETKGPLPYQLSLMAKKGGIQKLHI